MSKISNRKSQNPGHFDLEGLRQPHVTDMSSAGQIGSLIGPVYN